MSDSAHFRAGGRKPMELRVHFQVGSALLQEGTTVDIGLGGAFIQTQRVPSPGSDVVVFLRSPTSWDPLEISCRVRWATDGSDGRPQGFGVRFESLTGAQSTALYELLQTLDYESSEGS